MQEQELAALEAAAKAATPEPWELLPVTNGGINHLCPVDPDKFSLLTVVHQDETPFGAVYKDIDAAFIAAANPATIKSLTAAYRAQAARIAELEATLTLRTGEYEEANADRLQYASRIADMQASQVGIRAQALEEAAKVCDKWADEDVPGAVKGRSIRLAEAIRALAPSAKAAALPAAERPADLETKLMADLDALRDEFASLSSALAFWLPSVPEEDGPIKERILQDVFYLGEHGPDKSAQELGWITIASPAVQPVAGGQEPDKLVLRGTVCEIGRLDDENGEHGMVIKCAEDSFMTIRGLSQDELRYLARFLMDDITITFAAPIPQAVTKGEGA